jgi:hypothetical protein
VREQQDVYYNGTSTDNLVALGIAFVVAAIVAPIVGILLGNIGLFWGAMIAILIGGAAGSALAQIVRRAVQRRRTREMRWFALAGILVGIAAGWLAAAAFGFGFPLLLIPLWIFAALAIGSALPFLR